MERKLINIGIDSSEKLIALGSKQAFVKSKQEYPQVCLWLWVFLIKYYRQNTRGAITSPLCPCLV